MSPHFRYDAHCRHSRPAPRRHTAVLTLLSMLGALLAGLVAAPAPAHAEGQFCTGKGVNVVVDFGDLGGGVESRCDQDGAGKTAADVFDESGFKLTPVSSFPGAICRVANKPAETPCAKMPPADAYWGLYVDKGGAWDYAPKGADELNLREGDFVGLAWQASKKSAPPATDPVAPSSASASPSTSVNASDQQPAEQDDSGISWWIPGLVILALVVVAAGAALSRRRTPGD